MSAKSARIRQMAMGLVISILLVTVVGIPTSVQAVSYKFASPTGTEADACTYTDPCNLQKAVDESSPGGLVYVAKGTYHAYAEPSDQVLLLNQPVTLYGGWDGVSGPDPVILNHDSNVTILDGENERRVVTITGYTGNAVLHGFSIKNGNATGLTTICYGAGSMAGCGGGILIDQVAVIVEDCIIENNVASTTSDDTYRTGYGGGIFIQSPALPGAKILNNIIRYNHASTATSGTAGYSGEGGGILEWGANDKELTITGNEIYNNEAAATSPMEGGGAGIAISDSYGLISGNYIHDNNQNQSSLGAGLYATFTVLEIAENRFINNPGNEALYLHLFNGDLTSNLIINPQAVIGIALSANMPGDMSILVNNVIAQHTTANLWISGGEFYPVTTNIYHNTLDSAPYGAILMDYATLTISNSIISNHTYKGFRQNSIHDTVNVNYTLFYKNADNGDIDYEVHPITSGDPAYVDAANDNYHIQGQSAARDVATDGGYDTDFDNEPRPMGSGATPYDVGADEFWWIRSFFPLLRKP